jgi:hypothetical protein
MITIPNWLTLTSFEELRKEIFKSTPITSLVHNGRGVWSSDFGSCSFILRQDFPRSLNGRFLRLFDKQGSVARNTELQNRFHVYPRFIFANSEFKKIPGSPVAYWVSKEVKELFLSLPLLGSIGEPRRGLQPGNTEKNVRYWHEVDLSNTAFCVDPSDVEETTQQVRWVGYTSGGSRRKWAGNLFYVVNWYKNGFDIKNGHNPIVPNEHLYFHEAISWSKVSIGSPSFRRHPAGMIPGDNSPFAIVPDQHYASAFASLNSAPTLLVLEILAPTLHFQVGDIKSIPIMHSEAAASNVKILVTFAENDWNAYEHSWDFKRSPLLASHCECHSTVESAYTSWIIRNAELISETKRLEEENNRLLTRDS